jgi:hypothetical protein
MRQRASVFAQPPAEGDNDLCRWRTHNLRATQFRVQGFRAHGSCSLFGFEVRGSEFGVRASGTKNQEPGTWNPNSEHEPLNDEP